MRTPEFLIDKVVQNEDNLLPGRYAVLIGRCGDVPIHKGHVFEAVSRYKPGRCPEDVGVEPVRLETIPVRLVVVEIQTLNRTLDLLGQGMTGAIFVQGAGLDRLADGKDVGQPLAVAAVTNGSETTPETASSAVGL